MSEKSSGLIAAVLAASTTLGGWAVTGTETALVAGRAVAVAGAAIAPRVILDPANYRAAFLSSTKTAIRDARGLPGGRFVDEYTGTIIPKVEASIDHIVPLREARDALGVNSPAYWAFANDPLNLAITSLSNNARKGAKGLRDSTAMFPDSQVDIMAIGRQVREKYGLSPAG